MYRFGWYATYKGNEYEFNRDMDKNSIIFTGDIKLTDESFNYNHKAGFYRKIVDFKELSNVYCVSSFVIIDGNKFLIVNENNENYLIETGDREIAEKFGLEMVDKGCYEKWIPKEGVQIIEEKKMWK